MEPTPGRPGIDDAKRKQLSEHLEKHRAALARFFQKEAQGLLRNESVDDLVQGTHMRALNQAEQFEYRSEKEFIGWLFLVARQHIGDRRDYWVAMRRDGGSMLRITTSAAGTSSSGTSTPGVNPAAQMIGPATFAMRREAIELAAKAIACLLPRDQEIVRAVCQGESNADIAKLLGVAYDAAEKAKARALDRFRKTFELLSRSG